MLRSLEQFIQTVEGQNNFWQQNAFLTCSWKFVISNTLEQLEFKLGKNYWDLKPAGKVGKNNFINTALFFKESQRCFEKKQKSLI